MVDDSDKHLSDDAAALRRGINRLARRMRTERSTGALNGTKLTVLGHLRRFGPTSAGALAAAEHQQPQSLTRVLAELERDGLLIRTRSPHDGRQSMLSLTDHGRAVFDADMAERDRWLAAALGALTANDRDLMRIAARVLDALADWKE